MLFAFVAKPILLAVSNVVNYQFRLTSWLVASCGTAVLYIIFLPITILGRLICSCKTIWEWYLRFLRSYKEFAFFTMNSISLLTTVSNSISNLLRHQWNATAWPLLAEDYSCLIMTAYAIVVCYLLCQPLVLFVSSRLVCLRGGTKLGVRTAQASLLQQCTVEIALSSSAITILKQLSKGLQRSQHLCVTFDIAAGK